ncbi:MAG: hypothetical protein M3347_15990 [Armatimonadota bacterium]|nr:hypothetical protein [Armatimonadota bacterium]
MRSRHQLCHRHSVSCARTLCRSPFSSLVVLAWGLGLLWPAPLLGADPERDLKAFQTFMQQVGPLEQTDPKRAIAQYEQYWQNHPDLYPGVAALLRSHQADLLYNNLKNPTAALQLLDEAVASFRETTQPAPGVTTPAPPLPLSLVRSKAQILASENRLQEATALWSENVDSLISQAGQGGAGNLRSTMRMVQQYLTLLERTGKSREVTNVLGRVLREVPRLMSGEGQEPPGSLYERLVSQLLTAKRPDEALRWAKLQYVLCPFDKEALERATRLLARVWASQDSFASVAAFAKAQEEPGAPNPLATVPLPEWDPATLQQVRAQPQLGPSERVTLLLATEDWHEAMLQARRALMTDLTNEQGVRDVARVFKAKDLTVGRANQFLQFLQNGEGTNPVRQFLQESEKAEVDKAAPQ